MDLTFLAQWPRPQWRLPDWAFRAWVVAEAAGGAPQVVERPATLQPRPLQQLALLAQLVPQDGLPTAA